MAPTAAATHSPLACTGTNDRVDISIGPALCLSTRAWTAVPHPTVDPRRPHERVPASRAVPPSRTTQPYHLAVAPRGGTKTPARTYRTWSRRARRLSRPEAPPPSPAPARAGGAVRWPPRSPVPSTARGKAAGGPSSAWQQCRQSQGDAGVQLHAQPVATTCPSLVVGGGFGSCTSTVR